jgi:hypothetical protein
VLIVPVGRVEAQRPEFGAIAGRVMDDREIAVPDATLTLFRDGTQLEVTRAAVSGRFLLDDLTPGSYALLVEQVGYQPVRISGLQVIGGATLRLHPRVERRPPPISAVEERVYRGAGAMSAGEAMTGAAVSESGRWNAATDAATGFSSAVTRFDGGFGVSANGLSPSRSLLVVDGLEELLVRHPGLPAEGGSAPQFTRRATSQIRLSGFEPDPAMPAAQGASLSLVTATGIQGVRPWATWSGSALAAAEDNPADSSGSSIAAGIDIGGGSDAATAWQLSAAWERRHEPGAAVSAVADSALMATIAGAAEVGAIDLGGAFAPVLHSWEGVTGSGGLRARVGRSGLLTARFAAASWEEEGPRLHSAASAAGTLLDASDLSGALSFQLSGEEWRSVTRLGVSHASRRWTTTGAGLIGIVSDAVALGSPGSLAGDISERRIQVGETVSLRSGAHDLTLGGLIAKRTFGYDWLAGPGNASWFGSTDDLEVARLASTSVSGGGTAADLSSTEYAVFIQDAWSVSPSLTLNGGVRYQGEKLPDEGATLALGLATRLGINNTLVPTSRSSAVGPRLGITWDAGGSGNTVLSLGGGLVPGRYDLAAFAEVARNDGGVIVDRFLGTMTPGEASAGVTTSAPIFTLYGDQVRAPRSAVFDASLRQALAPGTRLTVAGGYRHADYHLRRSDFNRPASPLAHDADGRAIWGVLAQFDGLVVAEPGSNRRFEEFDHVWGLASTGYVDHYQATVGLERQVAEGVSISVSYTWAQTEDNLVGQLSGDPADRASPLEVDTDGADWSEGRSDLDIPGRASASLRYVAPGSRGLAISARWRWRSGLPFTPGFRDGVDANGDGSVRNDPVALGSVAGLDGLLSGAGCDAGSGGFAARNSCREGAVHALDLHLGIRLPIAGNRLRLTVDAFNLVSSETGVVDRAAVLVDPDGTISTDGDGRLSLPLMLNDNFGQLLARRNDPRTIRFGLALEN